jgi:nucleoside 2-deoxyribosyltransferase
VTLKIYFAGSICGGRGDADFYAHLIDHLNGLGIVLTEHVGHDNVIEEERGLSDTTIHDRDMAWLLDSDVVVADVTIPSLGVGYEIGRAIEHGKPVLCLYRPQAEKRLSAMLKGSGDVVNVEYDTLDEAKSAITRFMKENDPSR